MTEEAIENIVVKRNNKYKATFENEWKSLKNNETYLKPLGFLPSRN